MKLAGAMGVGQKWLSVHQTPLPFAWSQKTRNSFGFTPLT
jgi:hypothetical protein